jgi:hypothetical protein
MVQRERSEIAPATVVRDDKAAFVAPLHDASRPDNAPMEFEFAGQKSFLTRVGMERLS